MSRRNTKPTLLTAEQERTLFHQMNYCRWRADHAESASPTEHAEWAGKWFDIRTKIAEYNLAIVVRIAYKFAQPGSEAMEEFIAMGNVGLMHAIDKFDASRGYKFSTYAWIAIRREMSSVFKKDRGEVSIEDVVVNPVTEDDPIEPENLDRRVAMAVALGEAKLTDRERRVIEMRFFTEPRMTLSQIGESENIGKERVRQVIKSALDEIGCWLLEDEVY